MTNQVDSSIGQFSVNRPQRGFSFNLFRGLIKTAFLIWGRGTSKSSTAGLLIDRVVKEMPRANAAIQGATFQQLLTRTLPGTLAFMEKYGWKRDRDYFINKFPNKGYLLPYECPLSPENTIFFVNHKHKYANAFTLFSQDRSSSGRGPNRDLIMADESLLLDLEKFTSETLATNRGNEDKFGNIKMHHGIFHFSSMPTGEHWLLEGSDYYPEDFDFISIRNAIIELELQFCENKDRKSRVEIWAQRHELSKQLRYYPSSDGRFYSEFSSFDNIENLTVRYIDDMYRQMPRYLFMIEILNKRNNQIQETFYPNLDRNKHCYKGHYDYSLLDSFNFDFEKLTHLDSLQDLDCNPDKPLDIGLDFGVAINWLIVGQYIDSIKQYNFLKNFYVKSPRMIDDIIKDFCDYYQHHRRKVVYIYPDAEGNVKRANVQGQKPYIEQIKKQLRQRGWTVVVQNTKKKNDLTSLHYITWSRCLAENISLFPKIRFNLINCKELLYSMEQTPAIDNKGRDIRKDKKSEVKLKSNREQATDAGDAADKIITGRFGYLNDSLSTGVIPLV